MPEIVRLEADLQPEAAEQLEYLAETIGANKTTALHVAIALADLLYREAAGGGQITIKRRNFSRVVDLPKVDVAQISSEVAASMALRQGDVERAASEGQTEADRQTSRDMAETPPVETSGTEQAGES